MTKQQEIQYLDEVLRQLPGESYLASTLKHIRVQFESDIRSDFETLPDLRIVASEHWCALKDRDAAIVEAKAHRQEVAHLTERIEVLKRTLLDYRDTFSAIAYACQDTCNRFLKPQIKKD